MFKRKQYPKYHIHRLWCYKCKEYYYKFASVITPVCNGCGHRLRKPNFMRRLMGVAKGVLNRLKGEKND